MDNDESKTDQPNADQNVQSTNGPVKKSGKGKKILLIVGGIILLLIILGSKGGNKNQQTSPSASPTPVPAAMKITAKELADDFDANQVAAEEKWKDKLVEFSAEISNITDTGISFYNVATKEFSMTQISCRIKDKQQLLPLKNGQTITVRGTVGDQTIGVIDINQCEVAQ